MKVIDMSKWGKYTGREALCSLPLSVSEFETRTGVVLEEFHQEGAGRCYCAFVQCTESRFFVQGFVSRDSVRPPLSVDMEGNQPQPMACLQELLDELGLSMSHLPWVKRDLQPPQWVLLRYSDDGQPIEVGRYFRESAAEWVRRQLEQNGLDKQYQVAELGSVRREVPEV